VLNVWVGPLSDRVREAGDERHEARDPPYQWRSTTRTSSISGHGGDENWRVYSVDWGAGTTKDLTPFKDVAAQIEE
jgi:hypothetical protein